MDIKQLEAFMAVADQKNFSKAAQVLNLSQPTVSASILTLEKELNNKLFDRHYNETNLTPIGEKLYVHAQKILDLRDDALFQCSNNPATLRIVASSIPYQYVVPVACSEFELQYPNIEFEVIFKDSEESIQDVLNEKADIGFVGSAIPNDHLCYQSILEEKLVLIVPKNEAYQNLVSDTISIHDVEKLPLIRRESGSGTWMETKALMQMYDVHPTIVAEYPSYEEIFHAVSQGEGVSIVSQLSAQDYARFENINILSLQENQIKRKLYSVVRIDHQASYALKQFERFIKRK